VGGVPADSPLALSCSQFLVGFSVVDRKNPTGLWQQVRVAIYRGLDERNPGGIDSTEKHAAGRQARRGVALFRGGLIDRQRLV
jgi:hypothetical protein